MVCLDFVCDARATSEHHFFFFQKSQGDRSVLDVLFGADSEYRHENDELENFQGAHTVWKFEITVRDQKIKIFPFLTKWGLKHVKRRVDSKSCLIFQIG